MGECARRLKAVMKDAGYDTVDDLAKAVSASRSQASNWLNAYHLPPVCFMAKLRGLTGITLDWIYLGDQSGLTVAKSIRLSAWLDGLAPPRLPPDSDDPPMPPPVDIKQRGLPLKKRAKKGASAA